MTHCRLWSEDGDSEYCKGARCQVSCTGLLYQCQNPQYFNVPLHRLDEIRKRDAVERTATEVEPFIKGGVR